MADVLHASSKNLIPRLSRHSSLNSSTPPKLRKAADRTSDLKNEVRNRLHMILLANPHESDMSAETMP
jgi:hypothetical protein